MFRHYRPSTRSILVLFSLLLILIMIFRPQGLLGRRDFSFRFGRSRKPPVKGPESAP